MASEVFSNGYALLVGVGADLPVTVADATALYNVLIDPARAAYPPAQVELLTEKQADRKHILDAFDRLIEKVNNNPDATAIVYFSGHGGQITRLGASPHYFLAPYGYNLLSLAETTISGVEFTDKIEAIRARKLVVLLDCCHAGGIPVLKDLDKSVSIKSAALPPDLLNILETGSGRVVVASSLESEYSYTGTPYSIFTTCIIEALEGKAAVKRDGFARILDTLIYLLDQVPQRATGPQHPFVNKILNLSDNFPLCYYAGGSKTVPGKTVSEVNSSISTNVSTKLTPGKRRQLEQRRAMLQQERDILAERVKRVRRSWIIEMNPAIKYQQEMQIQEDENTLTHLDRELDEIERMLE